MLYLAASFKNFFVTERSRSQARSEVGDAGDAEDFKAHVASDDGFRHGGHADQRGAEGAEGANLGGGFEAGTGDGEINAFFERETFFVGGLAGQGSEGAGGR